MPITCCRPLWGCQGCTALLTSLAYLPLCFCKALSAEHAQHDTCGPPVVFCRRRDSSCWTYPAFASSNGATLTLAYPVRAPHFAALPLAEQCEVLYNCLLFTFCSFSCSSNCKQADRTDHISSEPIAVGPPTLGPQGQVRLILLPRGCHCCCSMTLCA